MAIETFNVLDILLYLGLLLDPPWLGQKKFQNKCSQKVGKRYFDIGFCKYSKYFLYVLSTAVQALYSLVLPEFS